MADPVLKPTNTGPDASELFVADRQKFWTSFTTFTTGAVIAVVLLLVFMAIFLT
jgi:hypothetical protein